MSLYANATSSWPKGLIGTIALIVAVELLIARHHVDFTHVHTHDWRVTGRDTIANAASAEILCLGDSQVKFGLIPRLVQQSAGRPAFNIAVCGGQPPASYYLLKRAIENGARPATIVISTLPHLMMYGIAYNNRQWNELLEPAEVSELALATRNASICADMALRTVFPSYQARREIRTALLNVLAGHDDGSRRKLAGYVRNWSMNQGAWVSSERSFDPRRVNPREWEGFVRPHWTCNAVNRTYLIKLLDLARSHGMHVYWLMPPSTRIMRQRRAKLAVDGDFEGFLADLQNRYANLSVIDGRDANYADQVFTDPLHLSAKGARALSVAVGALIRNDSQPGPLPRPRDRWLKLPTYRDQPADPAIENVEQSRLALDLKTARR